MNSIIKELPAPLLSDTRRIVGVWIGRLGDLLIATPALRSLRERFPQARITLVIGQKGADAAKLCPGIDEVLTLKSAAHPLSNLRLMAELRKPADLLIDFNSAFSRASAVLCRLANARVKLSFDKGKGRWAYTHLLEAPSDTEHMLDRYARLALALKAPYDPTLQVRLSEEDQKRAKKILDDFSNGKSEGLRRIAIHPGNFKKFDNRWPEEKFVELTNRLLDKQNLRIFYMTGPGEEGPVAGIVSQLKREVPILPSMPVGVTAAMLSLMDLLIVNATGTTHLAAAVGTPTFSFLSRYTKTVWMPRSGPHFSVVSDSWTSCRDIPVDVAWKELENVLQLNHLA